MAARKWIHGSCILALGASLAFSAPALAGDVSVQLDAGSGFSLKNSAGTTERLRVNEATGNVSRNGALFVHTTGSSSTFVGAGAGNTTTTGNSNSGFGTNALATNTTGSSNAAFGRDALRFNTSGVANSAFGTQALYLNSTGFRNSAFGDLALFANSNGVDNSAFGRAALAANSSGSGNTAVGSNTLSAIESGSRNIAVGESSGSLLANGGNNIYIDNFGNNADSGKIRIGRAEAQNEAYIAGIFGNAVISGGLGVVVAVNGELGTVVSSGRFKQDVQDMAAASDVLMKLRPVTFRYTEEAVGAEDAKTPQYGLIAEEVAEVAPELVAPDLDGRPYSVKYHELPALLLNEVQVQRRTIATLEARIAELEKRPLYTAPAAVAR